MTRVLVACVGAVAVAWWMGSRKASNTESTPPPPPYVERIDSRVDAAATEPLAEEHEQPPEPVATAVQKYAALLDQLPPLTASRLQALLVASVSPGAHEREISLLLNAEEYSLYEQLRESDDIQAHLQTFAIQVQRTSPLDPQQQRALLLAKLNHPATAQWLVLDPELDQASIPAMERAYARDVATVGIDYQARAFLDEVRPVLTTEQWSALAEFERASASKGRSAVQPEQPATALGNP